MIKAIDIHYFRCFHKTSISGFKQFNLFGGLNNSGKTSLLEALYFGTNNGAFNSSRSENDADYFNYLKNIYYPEFTINLEIILEDGKKLKRDFLSNVNHNRIPFKPLWFCKSDGSSLPNSLDLIVSFDRLSKLGYDDQLIEYLKIIDPSINHIRTYATNPKLLFLRKNFGNAYHPLNYFGDAINKLIKYVLIIYNLTPNSVLLLDEIENGIHFSVQKEFIKNLMKLCLEKNIQIFATTHSEEFINAYIEVSEELFGENQEQATYFEMARHFKTDEIIGSQISLDTLEYKIEHHKSFRGE